MANRFRDEISQADPLIDQHAGNCCGLPVDEEAAELPKRPPLAPVPEVLVGADESSSLSNRSPSLSEPPPKRLSDLDVLPARNGHLAETLLGLGKNATQTIAINEYDYG